MMRTNELIATLRLPIPARRPLRFLLISAEQATLGYSIGFMYTGATPPPRRCLRSPVFDAVAGKQGRHSKIRDKNHSVALRKYMP